MDPEVLILKFLTDSLTDDETAQLNEWLKNPKNQERYKALVLANQQLDFQYRELDLDAAYQNIMDKSRSKTAPVRSLYRPTLKYAATVLLFLGLGYGLYTLVGPNVDTNIGNQITLTLEDGSVIKLNENESTILTNSSREAVGTQKKDQIRYETSPVENGAVAYNELKIPYGKRFKVFLSDRSSVFLNAGTTFRYPVTFSATGPREVFLEGEAFFKVAENEERPFILTTSKVKVQVLGTQFNVSSYHDESRVSTTLVEGSVSVSGTENIGGTATSENITIVPGEQASYSDGKFIVQEVNLKKYTAWTHGKLSFIDDRFETIVNEIERHYDVQIENQYSALDTVRYTATFDIETIDQVLDLLQMDGDFRYQRVGRKITISEN